MNNRPIKYFLYARKSSESEDRQVQSIDDQTSLLKELAKRQGLKIVKIYTESKSAKMPNARPLFTEMVKSIEKGEADGILCWAMNRLFRNPVDQGTIGWMLQSGKIKSIQTIDKTYLPDDNVLLFNVEGGMANQYIIDLRKMCKRGMQSKIQKGWRPGLPPLGYINNKEDKTIEVETKSFDLIRKMWDLLLAGTHNPSEILDLANNHWGLRTTLHKRRGGLKLSKSGIYKMFTSVFYTGMFNYGGNLYEGKHKPMISVDEYDKAQLILGLKGKPRNITHQLDYTGVFRCGICDSMITATKKTKFIKQNQAYKSYIYYHCTRKKISTTCDNSIQKPITKTKFEKLILDEIGKYEIHEEILKLIFEYSDQSSENDSLLFEKKYESQLRAKQKAEMELEKLNRQFYREMVDEEFFIKEKKQLQSTIEKLGYKLKNENLFQPNLNEQVKKAFKFAKLAKYHLQKGNAKTKRVILNKLGSNWKVIGNKLDYIRAEWAIPIQEFSCSLNTKNGRLEPKNKLIKQGYNAQNRALSTQLCNTVDAVRTAIKDDLEVIPSFDIPEISEG